VDVPPSLTEEENQKLIEWFESNQVAPNCSFCGDTDFATYRLVSEPPMLALRCKRCAHILFFDSQQIGIQPPEPS
jgi:hypothetical protein